MWRYGTIKYMVVVICVCDTAGSLCEGIQDTICSLLWRNTGQALQYVPFCEGIQYTELRLPLWINISFMAEYEIEMEVPSVKEYSGGLDSNDWSILVWQWPLWCNTGMGLAVITVDAHATPSSLYSHLTPTTSLTPTTPHRVKEPHEVGSTLSRYGCCRASHMLGGQWGPLTGCMHGTEYTTESICLTVMCGQCCQIVLIAALKGKRSCHERSWNLSSERHFRSVLCAKFAKEPGIVMKPNVLKYWSGIEGMVTWCILEWSTLMADRNHIMVVCVCIFSMKTYY